MPFYQKRGEIPSKKHTQFRNETGELYSEELVSRGGFSSIYSNIYHTNPPTVLKAIGKSIPHKLVGVSFRHQHLHIDSSNVRGMLSGSNSISYTSGTGDIRAPQPLDSSANPTFNQLRGPSTFIIDPAAIGDSTGTVRILGNLTVEGTNTIISICQCYCMNARAYVRHDSVTRRWICNNKT